jgi:hypothetical protein
VERRDEGYIKRQEEQQDKPTETGQLQLLSNQPITSF